MEGPELTRFITGPIIQFEAPQGFQVVVARATSTEGDGRAIVGIYTRNGRTTEAIPGFAHMSEHAFANASATTREGDFPEGSTSLDSNAQARPDYVSAWLTVNRPDGSDAAPRALALRMSAKIWGAQIDTELLEEQRQRVVDELGRGLSSGRFLSERALEYTFFGNRPSMADEIHLMAEFDQDDILDYLAMVYRPSELVLVVAGDIDVPSMVTFLQESFERRGEILATERMPNPELFRPAEVIQDPGIVHRESDTAEGDWVVAGFTTPPPDSEDYLALLVLDQHLMGGRDGFEELWTIRRSMNSPLGQRLSASGPLDYLGDGRGYGAASPPLAEASPAYFTIQFGADEMDLTEGVTRLQTALTDISQSEMNDADILASRDALLGFYRLWLNAENLRPPSDHLAGLAFYHREGASRLGNLAEDLVNVTPDDVRRVFDQYVINAPIRFATFEGITPVVEPETAP